MGDFPVVGTQNKVKQKENEEPPLISIYLQALPFTSYKIINISTYSLNKWP
jgi:hypothetical protein